MQETQPIALHNSDNYVVEKKEYEWEIWQKSPSLRIGRFVSEITAFRALFKLKQGSAFAGNTPQFFGV